MMLGFRLHYILNTLHLWGLVTVQKYNEFPKHARNVNFVLTFRKRQNLRKIAANKNMRLCNVLINNTLHDNNILILSQIEIFAIFSGLPP